MVHVQHITASALHSNNNDSNSNNNNNNSSSSSRGGGKALQLRRQALQPNCSAKVPRIF